MEWKTSYECLTHDCNSSVLTSAFLPSFNVLSVHLILKHSNLCIVYLIFYIAGYFFYVKQRKCQQSSVCRIELLLSYNGLVAECNKWCGNKCQREPLHWTCVCVYNNVIGRLKCKKSVWSTLPFRRCSDAAETILLWKLSLAKCWYVWNNSCEAEWPFVHCSLTWLTNQI